MSSSESEAPETITLKNAKSQSKKQNRELEERQKATARLRKERNQAKDARLKAEKRAISGTQSKPSKKKGEDKEQREREESDEHEERLRLERRMQKAMVAAQEEDESGDGGDDSDIIMGEAHSTSTVSGESDDEGSKEERGEILDNPDYLPNHYFEQLGSSSKSPPTAQKAKDTPQWRRRKVKDRKKREERVIGSRAIHTLSSTSLSAAGRTTPSVKTKRFLRRQLKGDVKTKGWERRPVAIGSLASRARPAGKFVRG